MVFIRSAFYKFNLLKLESQMKLLKNTFKSVWNTTTGINQRQLWHYASGMRKPRPAQRKRIEKGLHKLGAELLRIGI